MAHSIKCGSCKDRHESVAEVAECYYPVEVCECELDYNCSLHKGGPTAIERINDEYASVQTEIDAQGYGY